MKEPKCKYCNGPHYKTFCSKAPRKTIRRSALKRPSYDELILKAYKASQKPRKVKQHNLGFKTTKPPKQAKISSRSNTERARLIRKADSVFSIYIRRKDSIGNVARCVTCGKQDHYKSMQNGHYVSRRKMSLRYDEMNCNVQCPNCNMNLGGNLANYRKYLIEKYGVGRVEALEIRGKMSGKITTVEIEHVISKYENLLKKMK